MEAFCLAIGVETKIGAFFPVIGIQLAARWVRMIPGGVASKRLFCLYQVTVFLFIPGGVYSHQLPCGGERFDGLYSPVEQLRRRFRGWRLFRDGWRFSCRAASPISNTVGGLDRRSRAADSGSAASIVNLVSGRVARGSSGYTIPGLLKSR